MPANRSRDKSLAYRAFRKARAAFSENFKHHGDFSAATGGAHIALLDAGVPFLSPLYMETSEAVQQLWRPSVERRLCQLESAAAEDEQFELRQDEDLFLETDR